MKPVSRKGRSSPAAFIFQGLQAFSRVPCVTGREQADPFQRAKRVNEGIGPPVDVTDVGLRPCCSMHPDGIPAIVPQEIFGRAQAGHGNNKHAPAAAKTKESDPMSFRSARKPSQSGPLCAASPF